MSKRRSIILNNITTSISLEEPFWSELERFAEQKGVSWQNFLRSIIADTSSTSNRAAVIKGVIVELLKNEKSVQQCEIVSLWEIRTLQEKKHINCYSNRLLAGRYYKNEIIIEDSEVSRHHIMFAFDNINWWAVDLNSKNGSFLNNKKFLVKKIKNKQKIKVGKSYICLTR